jgi:PST family polysaccharide transporter
MKQKLLKNISWLFFDKIIRIFGGLLIGIWVARYLGPSDYGILNYAMAYTAMFMLFVNLGLDEILVRELVKKPKLTNYLLGSAFVLKIFGALVAICLIFFSFNFMVIENITKTAILIMSIAFILQSFDVIDYYYQSKILSKYSVIARSFAFIMSSGLKIYLLVYKYSVLFFVGAGVIDILMYSLFLSLIYVKQNGSFSKWKFNIKIVKNLLKYSWPLALSVFLITIHTRIDQLMIGTMLDIKEVGIYSVAVKLAEFWIFIPSILVSTLMPYFVNLRNKDAQLYHFRLLQLYSLMFWMGAFVGIVTIIFGEDIIVLLFGDVYKDAYVALVYNIWIGVFIAQAVARGIWMINENLQLYRIYNNILAIITNISLNIILIPKFGISGAALASLLSIGIGTWFYSLLFKPLRESTIDMITSIVPLYILKYKEKYGKFL